jgi:hypothetical protein
MSHVWNMIEKLIFMKFIDTFYYYFMCVYGCIFETCYKLQRHKNSLDVLLATFSRKHTLFTIRLN